MEHRPEHPPRPCSNPGCCNPRDLLTDTVSQHKRPTMVVIFSEGVGRSVSCPAEVVVVAVILMPISQQLATFTVVVVPDDCSPSLGSVTAPVGCDALSRSALTCVSRPSSVPCVS